MFSTSKRLISCFAPYFSAIESFLSEPSTAITSNPLAKATWVSNKPNFPSPYLLHEIPRKISYKEATFIEPLAAAYQTFEMMPLADEDKVI
ncbi:unnamed protein product, partial [marine sediment metagenome]